MLRFSQLDLLFPMRLIKFVHLTHKSYIILNGIRLEGDNIFKIMSEVNL